MKFALLICCIAATSSLVCHAEHWAFQPITAPAIPAVEDSAWVKTPIDAFILAKLESRGLRPSPPADPRTLLRRLAFNLTGLPPSFAEVQQFSANPDPGGAIDRLLASPHFGERWARHWLDVARYSDTKGYAYSPEEFTFVHSWTYRDWVVQALNEDLPFDQFLLRQLAADQLLDDGDCTPSDLAAMGFLTLGRRFIGVEQDIIDDRIDVVTRGLLGLTVSCSRCHDHKFDPIPTADYYALYGIFDSSAEKLVALREIADAELAKRRAALDAEFEKRAQEAEQRFLDRAGDYLVAALDLAKIPKPDFAEIITKDDLNPEQIRRWHEYLSQQDTARNPVFAPWKKLERLSPEDFAAGGTTPLLGELEGADELVLAALRSPPLEGREDMARRYGKLLKAQAQQPAIAEVISGAGSPIAFPRRHVHEVEWLFDDEARTELKKRLAEVERRIIELGESAPHAVAMEDQPVPENARILVRGDYSSQGAEVPRRALTILGGEEFHHGSGRLELARSIANDHNPLTARVIVNRLWQQHFGTGLVNTPSDFGLRSELPSHPELLDFLARYLIDHHWSLKSVHRLIAQSAVYQQASSTDPATLLADPENRLLSHYPRRRLDFESMRDALLAASGELDLSIGGVPGSLLGTAATRRRCLYGRIDRQFLPSALRDFDFANPELHSPMRHRTNVPQQALFFMNSPFVRERAVALARRVAAGPVDQRIRDFFEITYQRDPTPSELANSTEFIQAALDAETSPPEPAETPAIPSPWRYGFGKIDTGSGRLATFTPLPHFSGEAWGGGEDWPDAKLGWLRLTASGGHTGNDLDHAAVRRWISPVSGTVRITGAIRLTDGCGDGIRAMVISDRQGILASWTAKFGERTAANLEAIEVTAGEAIDFAADCGTAGNFSCDEFEWSPAVQQGAVGWDAGREFAGEITATEHQLDPWERFAHALLLANPFIFID